MDKKYLAKIIATDNEDIQMISLIFLEQKLRFQIKYLSSSKVFLLSMVSKVETDQNIKINSI